MILIQSLFYKFCREHCLVDVVWTYNNNNWYVSCCCSILLVPHNFCIWPSLGYPSGTTCSLTHIMTDSFNRPPQYLWLPVENYCISTHWTTGSFNWPPQSPWWNVKKYHISTHWTTGSFNRPPWSPWLPVNKYCFLTLWMTGSFNRPSQSLWLPVEDIAPQPIVKQVLPFLLLFLWLYVKELASWPTWWQVLLISDLTSVVTRKGEFCTSTIYYSSCYIAFSFL